MTEVKQFKAALRLLSTEEGGRKQPVVLVSGYAPTRWYRPQFAPYAESDLHYDCQIDHPAPETISWFELAPGEEADVIMTLFAPLSVEVGAEFRLYEGGQWVGSGVVTTVE